MNQPQLRMSHRRGGVHGRRIHTGNGGAKLDAERQRSHFLDGHT
jgi:hypothetical protein